MVAQESIMFHFALREKDLIAMPRLRQIGVARWPKTPVVLKSVLAQLAYAQDDGSVSYAGCMEQVNIYAYCEYITQ